jgi:hypothetical protein
MRVEIFDVQDLVADGDGAIFVRVRQKKRGVLYLRGSSERMSYFTKRQI